MPATVEVTRRLRITGFLLTKAQTCSPVLKTKNLSRLQASFPGRSAQVSRLRYGVELPGFAPHTKGHPDPLPKSSNPLLSGALQRKSSLGSSLAVHVGTLEPSLLLRHVLTVVRKIQKSVIEAQKGQPKGNLDLEQKPNAHCISAQRVRKMKQLQGLRQGHSQGWVSNKIYNSKLIRS